MNHYMRKIYLLAVLGMIYAGVGAQQWNWAEPVGKQFQSDYKPRVRTNNAGDLFTTATFFGFGRIGDTVFYSDTSFYWNRGNYVARLNNAGQLIWAQFIGGQNTFLIDLSTDNNNNAYVLGHYAIDLLFSDTSLTGNGIFIAAFGPTGSRLWVKTYAQSANWGNCIANDNNNNLFYAHSGMYGQWTIRKIAPADGSDIWLRSDSCQGTIRDIRFDSQNNLYLAGSFGGDIFKINNTVYYQDTGYFASTFLVKMNTAGTILDVEIVRGGLWQASWSWITRTIFT